MLPTVVRVFPGPCFADTALGDWGHFMTSWPAIYLNNPAGREFTLTVHVQRWPIKTWNPGQVPVRVTAPDQKVVFDGQVKLEDATCKVEVPAGPKGVYQLEVHKFREGGNFWVESSLDQSVVWTGKPTGHVWESRRLVFQASVPRRWWFWVPKGTTAFICRAQRAHSYMSQREDWGFFIITPRGQRIRALWGQPPNTPRNEWQQEQVVEVEVEPGAGGRFWCVEVRLGDSHNYSKPNFGLDGVPPYLARSPEEWFDPATGQSPAIDPYDESPFIQSARTESVMKEKWPNLEHFSPCPSLGDPDGVEVLGDARFALWNPEGRDLGFRIGTYLPRREPGDPAMAQVKIAGPDGQVVLDKKLPMLHIHHNDGHPTDVLKTGKGVSFVDVSGVERWMSFTYPATPLVLVGKETEEGWKRFLFSSGTVRNWYLFVPKGVTEFSIRAAARQETDIVHLEVCAPDRTLALIYDNKGERTVKVPRGLDGRIWYLRPDVGSATRMVTEGAEPRYLDLCLTVDIKGIPGYLAPTWEQWFDPASPVPAGKRSALLNTEPL
jgi:hypothetical protein